ncbi:MAG: RluA family pseudouridine synthase [Bacteriovorax sp.]|jgi:tRNA pseudouridine32 synthase/23S rRNA pseudouridine746 synthase
MNKNIVFKKQVTSGDPLVLIEFLEKHSGLSKTMLKKVLNNGSVWVRLFKTAKLARNRRATQELTEESSVEFYYDPKLAAMTVPVAIEVFKSREWGLWYKPQGLLSQGTEFGDHCSILRQIEKAKNKAWLVHRLDREAHGLMLFAYTKKAAALFSELWQKHDVRKIYKATVLGVVLENGEINFPLDGKDAKTTYTVLEKGTHTTELLVEIHTGRLHQIRRHMDMIGHPVLGDPKYGAGNKNTKGLSLMAYKLQFIDPFTKKEINFELPTSVYVYKEQL